MRTARARFELMSMSILEVKGSNRLMAYLTERNIEYIRIEEEAMTPEEARRIWEEIEPNWRGVCYKSGMGSMTARIEWTLLLRKMMLIKNKAEENHDPVQTANNGGEL